MMQHRPAVHRTIIVVDVEGFGDYQRTNTNQVAVRNGLYRILENSFRAVQISWQKCQSEDRGDGVFILAPPELMKAVFVESLPGALVDGLTTHNASHPPAERIRLRMALHAGEINYDDHGVTSASINHTFRLVDAPVLKEALKGSTGVLAVITSSWFYDEVVRHSRAAEPNRYRQVTVTVKETITTAWLALPDHEAQSVEGLTSNPHHNPVPRLLPPAPWSFVGRQAELAWLTDSASNSSPSGIILSLAGMVGVGKTWLALYWASLHLNSFPDGQLYVNLRGFEPSGPPLDPEAAVRSFLDALGLGPESIPADPTAQAALYRILVRHKRMLIVLDNARDSAQVIPLLPGEKDCVVIVTSRHQLTGLVTAHGARPLTLGTLDHADARLLMAKRLGDDRLDNEPDATDELLRRCAGLPLALSVVAAQAAIHPEFPLVVLASGLEDGRHRLDALDAGELTTNLRTVLSWSYRALENDEARAFRLLGLSPGPDIGVAAAAVLFGELTGRTVALLRALENASLLHQLNPGRYRMHDLVRLHAAEQAQVDGSADHGVETLRKLIGYYLHASFRAERRLYPHRNPIDIGDPPVGFAAPTFDDDASLLEWFRSEHACLLAAQAKAAELDWHPLVWQLAWTMHGYLWRSGHVRDQLITWGMGLQSAEEIRDTAVQALALRLLGQASARADLPADAKNHLNRAIQLAREAGDAHGEARAYYDLAVTWQKIDDREAMTFSLRALELFRSLNSPVWEAEGLSAVGWNQARLGLYQDALESCQQALVLFSENHNRQGQATTLDCLGYIAYQMGQYIAALTHYRHSLALRRDLGAAYDEADTLDHLGQVYAALGRNNDARRAWEHALALNRAQHRNTDVARIENQLSALNGHMD